MIQKDNEYLNPISVGGGGVLSQVDGIFGTYNNPHDFWEFSKTVIKIFLAQLGQIWEGGIWSPPHTGSR